MADTQRIDYASATVTAGEAIDEIGIMICMKAGDQEAYKGADTATYKVIGINNGVADEGDELTAIAGVFLLENSGDITQAHIGRKVYVEDEKTVVLAVTTNSVVAGIVVDVVDSGVWIDNTPSAIASDSVGDSVTALTDSSGGTAGANVIAEVTDVATTADAIALLAEKINEIIALI